MSEHPLDRVILDLATSQSAMVSTAQLTTLGVSPQTLVHLVATGVLKHPGRGLYAVSSLVEPSPAGWHRQLAAGAQLIYQDAILSGTSSLLAHGVTTWGVDLARVRIVREVDKSTGLGCFHISPRRGLPAVDTDWGPALPVAEAVVQLAMDGGVAAALVSADDALHKELVTPHALTTAYERVSFWPRSSRARTVVVLADGRRESVGETRCATALLTGDIEVIPQFVVTDDSGAFVARSDFLVKGTKVLIEFDGKMKYAAGDPETLWAEKRREDRLRALGYSVVRITWSDLERPGAVLAKVRAALGRALVTA